MNEQEAMEILFKIKDPLVIASCEAHKAGYLSDPIERLKLAALSKAISALKAQKKTKTNGATATFAKDDICEYIRANILTTSEAAELLQVSRQRISLIVKNGDIIPIKNTSQGMLFFRSDIHEYKLNKDRRFMFNYPCPRCGGNVKVKPDNSHYADGTVIKTICTYCNCKFGISLCKVEITERFLKEAHDGCSD